mgnify:CR=1 FL=1
MRTPRATHHAVPVLGSIGNIRDAIIARASLSLPAAAAPNPLQMVPYNPNHGPVPNVSVVAPDICRDLHKLFILPCTGFAFDGALMQHVDAMLGSAKCQELALGELHADMLHTFADKDIHRALIHI